MQLSVPLTVPNSTNDYHTSKAGLDSVHKLAKLLLSEKSNDVKLNKSSIGGICIDGIPLHCNHRNSSKLLPKLPLTLHPSNTR